MIWTAERIKRGLFENPENPEIVISDYDESRLGPNSYDLRLSDRLISYKQTRLLDCKYPNDIVSLNERWKIDHDEDKFIILEPGKLYLGSTMEYTESHTCIPIIEGKSSIGRLGIQVHLTAGLGDIGFCGHWTLEISVVHRIKVYSKMPICQIMFHSVDGAFGQAYQGKYKNQGVEPEPSKMYLNWADTQFTPSFTERED